MLPVWPRSSVLCLAEGFSGFQMRRVREVEPVARKAPVGENARQRMLSGGSERLVEIFLWEDWGEQLGGDGEVQRGR
jgi:hypothetical protein